MEQNERDVVQRGDEARRILEAEAFKLAFDGIRAQITKQWKESSIRDAEGQRLLLQYARVADDFEKLLRSMVSAGDYTLAQIELNKLRSESKARQMMRRVF